MLESASNNDKDLRLLSFWLSVLRFDPGTPEDRLVLADSILSKKPGFSERTLGKSQLSAFLAELLFNVKSCTPELFTKLLPSAAGINAKMEGWAAIHLLAHSNRVDLLALLLDQPGIDINLLTDKGESALFIAANNRHPKIVDLLLQKGANPHLANDEKELPIHWACHRANYLCVKLLLNADPTLATAQDEKGRTPAHYLAQAPDPIIEDNNNIDVQLWQHAQNKIAITELLPKTALSIECVDNWTPAEIARYYQYDSLAVAMEKRQILSLYQLCQKAICKFDAKKFQEAKAYLPESLWETLEMKKCRLE